MKNNTLSEFWSQFKVNQRKIYYRNYEIIENDELSKIIKSDVSSLRFCENITKGSCFIIKNVFSYEMLKKMRFYSEKFRSQNDEKFNKIVDGVSDFHRIIDKEKAKLYSLYAIKHSHYMFRWNATNPDAKLIWAEIDSYWSKMKYLGGFSNNEYVNNLPSQGPTDRIQFVHYPANGGVLHDHVDPDHNQKFVIGVNMSKRGVDYEKGGFYTLDAKNKKIDFELLVSPGDALVCDARLIHGVSTVVMKNLETIPEWNIDSGRWYLGLYTNDSDYKTRVTATNLEPS